MTTLRLLLLGLLLACGSAAAKVPRQIDVCDIGSEWPPYTYRERQDGQPTGRVVGQSVSLLRQILSRKNIEFQIELIPWRRCLAEVASGKYAMLVNASTNAERSATYLVTTPYYHLTGVYLYARERPPPPIRQPEDLRALRVCGQSGYNYVNFGLSSDQVLTGTPDFDRVILKLKAGRCDVVLTRLEIVAGQKYIDGKDYLADPALTYGTPTYMAPEPFHMMVSRQLAYSAELLEILNEGIQELGRPRSKIVPGGRK